MSGTNVDNNNSRDALFIDGAERAARLAQFGMRLEALNEHIGFVQRVVSQATSPVVFCHNDLQEGVCVCCVFVCSDGLLIASAYARRQHHHAI